MKSHIDHLAKLANVQLIPVTDMEAAGSWMEHRVAWVPITHTKVDYFVALHELGHFSINDKCSMLEEEYRAWWWALSKARFAPSKEIWRLIHTSMAAYVKKAKRDNRIKMLDSSHPFWTLLHEAREKANA